MQFFRTSPFIPLYSHIFWGLVPVFFLLTSCGTYKTFEIETFNPASITFPHGVNTLMIVNNAAQQPDHVGHRIEEMRDSQLSASADSTAYDLCLSLGKAISEAGIFDDVRLCEDTLRRDSAYYDVKLFSKDESAQICDEYGVDAFIALDRLVFSTNLTRHVGEYGFLYGRGIEVEATGELHVYLPDAKEVFTFPFRDSLFLFWYEDNGYASYSREDFNAAMRYLSTALGEKLNVNFVPYWSSESRWYYTSFSSEWKRGTAFAANGKWAEAEEIWKSLLPKIKSKKQRAQLCSNLALCSEMRADFNRAVEYAEKSFETFKSLLSEDDSFVKLQKFYVEILKKRLNNEDLLSKQLREKL